MKNKILLEGYIHIRPVNIIPRPNPNFEESLTISYRLYEGYAESRLRIGISVCSKQDQFCKKTGRILAYKRMLKNPYGTENFGSITTSIFKSKRGRKKLIKFIIKTYMKNMLIDQIKRHIYAIS